jgi:hypothetical protein
VLDQVGYPQGLLIDKQSIVHFPKLTLLVRALRRLGGFESEWMNLFEWQMPEDVSDFSGVDELTAEFVEDRFRVPTTEWTLEVGKLNKRQLRGAIAEEW